MLFVFAMVEMLADLHVAKSLPIQPPCPSSPSFSLPLISASTSSSPFTLSIALSSPPSTYSVNTTLSSLLPLSLASCPRTCSNFRQSNRICFQFVLPNMTSSYPRPANLFSSGWLVQWSVWLHCEISSIGFDNAGRGETCFQVNLEHRQYSMVPIKSSEGVVNGRFGLGTVVIALYLASWTMSLMALLRNRRRGAKGVKIESTEMR